MSKVITYQSPSGETIDLTEAQVAWLEKEDAWPRDSRGLEFCTVSHGLHHGFPTFQDDHLRKLVGLRASDDRHPAITSQEPFCACGRIWSECDGSRANCHKR